MTHDEMDHMSQSPFRSLPPVHQILQEPGIKALSRAHSHEVIVAAVRAEVQAARKAIQGGGQFDAAADLAILVDRVTKRVTRDTDSTLRMVINATGVVLHTNLGRAPMAEPAARAAYEAARGYLNLEIDLATGKRSSRQMSIREMLVQLTGAESGTAVNNCAAATFLVLHALAPGKEVVVSRGQLVEIGGSFRIPEIMAASGAFLKEVGTTNITRIADYEKAIGLNTALIMRVHTSNFRVTGFTSQPTLAELASLGKKHRIPVVDDVGSGAMLDFSRFGLPGDPVVSESIRTGADLVLFSGDKLLGGPQAGLIAGRKSLVQRIERDPLMRTYRLDKMALSALEATLRLYRNPERALVEIPVLKMLALTIADLRPRADRLAGQFRALPGLASVEVREDAAPVGGGSLPELTLPTIVIALRSASLSEKAFAERLRLGNPAVVAHVRDAKILLDLRTIFEYQESALLEAVAACVAQSSR